MDRPWWAPKSGLIPFAKMSDAEKWIEENSRGWVCIIQGNARILMNPVCRGDMRVLNIFSGGMWV